MAKRNETQARLERLQQARAEALTEIGDVDREIAELVKRRAELEGAAEGGASAVDVRGLVGELGAVIDKAVSLQRVREALQRRAGAIAGEIQEARAEVNRAEIGRLRLQEKAKWDAIEATARQLAADVKALHEVQAQIGRLSASPIARVPPALINLLEPLTLRRWLTNRWPAFNLTQFKRDAAG